MIRLNRTPSPRDLRLFAVLGFIFLSGAGVVAWRRGSAPVAYGFGSVGLAILGAGLFFPRGLRVIYLGAAYASFPFGFVLSYLSLGVLYFLAITPVGGLMRLLGHDPLARKFEPAARTYWRAREGNKPAASYFRPH